MKYRKRSTKTGAALIFMGILAGVALCRLLVGDSAREKAIPAGLGQSSLVFTETEAKLASLRYAGDCAYRPDVEQLVCQALDWDLTGEAPTVLILHTHGTESYTQQPGEDYEESSDYRTLDTDHNMVALGDYLAELLEQAGIRVVHDRQLHDYPSYSDAYTNSRQAVTDCLTQYPSICLVLDLHRDAAMLSDGSQYAPAVTVDGKTVAQIMLVVGSDASGMTHPLWQENLALGLKLQVLLERNAPGITRTTLLRAQRYNQDLSTGALIVEIGAAGNTFDQAMGAIPYLAEAIIALRNGAAAG